MTYKGACLRVLRSVSVNDVAFWTGSFEEIQEVVRPCIWLCHLRENMHIMLKELPLTLCTHTHNLSLLCLRRKLKHFSGSDIILSNPYSVLLTECIFSKAEIILSRKVIFFNNPACWQMFKREKNLQLFWECSAWYLQVYLFCHGKEHLLVCTWTIQLLMLWKKSVFALYLGEGALGEVFWKKIAQFLVTIQWLISSRVRAARVASGGGMNIKQTSLSFMTTTHGRGMNAHFQLELLIVANSNSKIWDW